MPLTEASKAYVEHALFVLPYYGYGWTRRDLAVKTLGPLDKLAPNHSIFALKNPFIVKCK